MKSKKLISLLTTAVLTVSAVASLTACGGDTNKDPEITGIEVTTAPTKVHYVLGETFDTTGMVVSKVFDNDTKEAIPATEYTYTPNTALQLNNKEVTIKWTSEASVEYSCKQKISVTNDIAEVIVTNEPAKTEYIAGEVFNPEGMTIKAKLENGTEEAEIAVTPDEVEYKTGKLVKSDEHFKMNYGGCDFYLDITVLHGAFIEAEAGQTKGAKTASQAPDKTAIAKDYATEPGNKDDGQAHRGIDKGPNGAMNCLDVLGTDSCYRDGTNGCTLDGIRVPVNTYVYDHQEWTETTGGTPAKSGMMQDNHINFTKGSQMFYRLTADKAGKVLVTFKMANPNVSGPIATATKLNEVIKFTVGEDEVNIPDTVAFAALDWTEYHSYNNTQIPAEEGMHGTTMSTDFKVRGQADKYTGESCTPIFAWQNITVEITVKEGVNDFLVESIWDGDVKLDSISCNADEDEITISMNTQFKPQVASGQLKVDNGKVLLGIIVDAQASNYTDEEIKDFLAHTTIGSIGNTTYNDNKLGSEEGGAPWTTSRADGGLGYDSDPASFTSGAKPQPVYNSVEKITEGAYEGCFCVWYDVTCTNSNQVGVFNLSTLSYGTAFENNGGWCVNDVLWDGNDDVSNNPLFAENDGYCYQVYCDTRMQYGSFQINNKNLLIVIQQGSYTGDNACAKLCKKYIPGRTDNDPWLHSSTEA